MMQARALRKGNPRPALKANRVEPPMIDEWLTDVLRWLGRPCFRIHGKARCERNWRVIDVYANARRNGDSRWPLWRGTCITLTSAIIVVGWDFAHGMLREQTESPASRGRPVEVAGGRLRDWRRRVRAGAGETATLSEIVAHECGHTWQALRIGPAYLPLVGSVTLFHEGPRPWSRFENEASAVGQFGGIVNGSVCPELMPGFIQAPCDRG
jgi:hypothetical protein